MTTIAGTDTGHRAVRCRVFLRASSQLWLLLAMVSCGSRLPKRSVLPGQMESAREVATRDPCELLLAIRTQIVNSKKDHDGPGSPWDVSFHVECCDEPAKVAILRPAVVTFEPSGPEIVGWGKACSGGPGGPAKIAGQTADFDYIGLFETTPRALGFDVTPAYIKLDEKGNEVASSTQGCPDFKGEARLSTRTAPIR